MRPIQSLSLFVLWGLLLGAANAEDWSQFQHNPAHTGRTTASIDPAKLTLQWSASDYFVPRIDRTTIVATGVDLNTGNQFITAFSLTGTKEWTYSPANSLIATAVPSGAIVVVAYFDLSKGYNVISVLDSATGVSRYTLPLPSFSNTLVLITIAYDPTVGKIDIGRRPLRLIKLANTKSIMMTLFASIRSQARSFTVAKICRRCAAITLISRPSLSSGGSSEKVNSG